MRWRFALYFDFTLDLASARQRLAEVPYLAYAGGRGLFSILDVASNVALYVPFGLLLMGWLRARGGGRGAGLDDGGDRPRRGTRAGGGPAGHAHRTPSVTDVITFGVAAFAGGVAYARYRAWARGPFA